MYHLIPFQAAPTSILGLGLATLVLQAGSVWPAVIAHGLFNGLGLVLTTVGTRIPSGGQPTVWNTGINGRTPTHDRVSFLEASGLWTLGCLAGYLRLRLRSGLAYEIGIPASSNSAMTPIWPNPLGAAAGEDEADRGRLGGGLGPGESQHEQRDH